MKMRQQLQAGHYFGQVGQRWEGGGIILTTSGYTQHTALPLHYHENAYFCLVSDGHYQESTAAQTLSCTTTDVIYHPAGITHSNIFPHAGAVCFNVEVTADWLQKLEHTFRLPEHITRLKGNAMAAVLHKLRKECAQPDAVSGLMVEGLVMEAMALYSRETAVVAPPAPLWLKQVRDCLHAGYLQELSLQTLADAAGVSPFHLVRTFKKVYGLSTGDYVNHLRIAHAVALLQAGELSLAHIALECGFADQSHFGKIFKRVKGYTPAQYRRYL